MDGVKPHSIVFGDVLLTGLRAELKARTFQPMPVRERLIPKAHGKVRMLGIATARDRVVQASLKLVLEPIFEADFKPCSYGFRPKRRAQDAIAEIHFLTSRSYEWVLEGDIKACFDEGAGGFVVDDRGSPSSSRGSRLVDEGPNDDSAGTVVRFRGSCSRVQGWRVFARARFGLRRAGRGTRARFDRRWR